MKKHVTHENTSKTRVMVKLTRSEDTLIFDDVPF